jgi:hypothetical protein
VTRQVGDTVPLVVSAKSGGGKTQALNVLLARRAEGS